MMCTGGRGCSTLACLCLALGVLCGCDEDPGPASTLTGDLEGARSAWESAGVSAYVYTYSGRYDGEGPSRPARLAISGGATVEARGVAEQGPWEDPPPEYNEPRVALDLDGNLIEDLFGFVESQIEIDASTISRVDYDKDLGYPRLFSQDYLVLGHEAYSFEIGCFRIAPYDDSDCSTFTGDAADESGDAGSAD